MFHVVKCGLPLPFIANSSGFVEKAYTAEFKCCPVVSLVYVVFAVFEYIQIFLSVGVIYGKKDTDPSYLY